MPDASIASSPKTASQPAQGGGVEKPVPPIVEVQKILLGTAGAALVAYFAYRLARRKDDRTIFLTAGARFREAFAADIAAIENGNLGHLDLMDYLRVGYKERHAAAFALFEGFVPRTKLAAFRDDWNRYRYGENENGSPAIPTADGLTHDELLFLCYVGPGWSWETHIQKSGDEKALTRIRKLLSYTQ
jgi:hypothetical protein